MGPTRPNRFYLHCGVTDRIGNSMEPSTLPTIWDRLAERGLHGRYYVSNVSTLDHWPGKYASITRPNGQFLADCHSGKLPRVAFVEPVFSNSITGDGNDDHPRADIRAGESFLYGIYRAVATSPAWRRTLLVMTSGADSSITFRHRRPPTSIRATSCAAFASPAC
jgi:phospholipase C